MSPLKPIILALLALAAAGLLIFGPRTGTTLPADRVIIHYWEHWSGSEAAAMQAIVDEFNATVGAQKHLYIDFLSQSNINQKTLLAAAAGVPPDIAGLWDQPLPQWAALDALLPLDDLAREHGITEENRGGYKPVYWKGCHYNGHLVALLSTPNDIALIYNKQAFLYRGDKLRAAGLDPTRPPHTLGELDAYAAALNTFDASGRLLSVGFLPTEPANWYQLQLPYFFGAEIYNESTGQFTLDSPQMLAAFRWIASYSRRLTPTALADFHSSLGNYGTANNPFLTGQLLMQLQGPWVAANIQQFKPSANLPDRRQWSAAAFPSIYTQNAATDDERIDSAVTWCGFDALVIPRGSKHPREAFEFIAYIQRPDIMEKLCAAHCKGSPFATHSPTWYPNHPNPFAELFDRLSSSPHAVTVPNCPIWPEACAELQTIFNRIVSLQQTPEEALPALQLSLQSKLAEFRLRHPENGR